MKPNWRVTVLPSCRADCMYEYVYAQVSDTQFRANDPCLGTAVMVAKFKKQSSMNDSGNLGISFREFFKHRPPPPRCRAASIFASESRTGVWGQTEPVYHKSKEGLSAFAIHFVTWEWRDGNDRYLITFPLQIATDRGGCGSCFEIDNRSFETLSLRHKDTWNWKRWNRNGTRWFIPLWVIFQ